MKAIILAAGRGVRLGSHTADKPKSLIPVGGKPLLQRSMENLKAAGFEKVTIVVGYRHEMIEEMLAKNFPPSFYQTVMNPDYTRGSGSSLMCAVNAMEGDFVIVESDLLYDTQVLKRMADPKIKQAMAMGFFNHGRKEVKLYLKKDNLIEKAQWAEPTDTTANGDWVGFTRLSAESAKALKAMVQEINPEKGKEIHYEYFIFELLKKFDFQAVYIQDLPWIEIDNEIDLEKAQKEICPKLDSGKKKS